MTTTDKITSTAAQIESGITAVVNIVTMISPQLIAIEKLVGVAATGVVAGIQNLMAGIHAHAAQAAIPLTDLQRAALVLVSKAFDTVDLDTLGLPPVIDFPPAPAPSPQQFILAERFPFTPDGLAAARAALPVGYFIIQRDDGTGYQFEPDGGPGPLPGTKVS